MATAAPDIETPTWIDAHVHFWALEKQHPIGIRTRIDSLARDFAISDLKPVAEGCGVGGVVLVQAAECVEETHYLLDLHDSNPDFIKGVCGWVDMAAPQAIRQLEELGSRRGFVGVRALLAFEKGAGIFQDAVFIAAARHLADKGLSLDLLCRPDQLLHASAFATLLPDLKINVNHCGRPSPVCKEWTGWAEGIADLAGRPNVTVKMSGLIERGGFEWQVADLEPYITHLLDLFGSSRLMFASNWPVLNLTGTYRRWWDALQSVVHSANLSPCERHDLFCGTAERFYGIDRKPALRSHP